MSASDADPDRWIDVEYRCRWCPGLTFTAAEKDCHRIWHKTCDQRNPTNGSSEEERGRGAQAHIPVGGIGENRLGNRFEDLSNHNDPYSEANSRAGEKEIHRNRCRPRGVPFPIKPPKRPVKTPQTKVPPRGIIRNEGNKFANKFGDHDNVCCGLVEVIKRKGSKSPLKVPIPLMSVDVSASVIHAVAKVDIIQVYVNKEKQPIEAIYYFPMNPDGAVTHFQAELEGRVVKGTVKPAHEAKNVYEDAVNSQKTTFLGEETKADIFKLCVGHLKPGSQVKVIIGYVTEVKNEPGSNAIRFYIPTTIAPRYVSPSETSATAKEIKSMAHSLLAPALLTLKVAVSMPGGIKSITSPTHKIAIDRMGSSNLQNGLMHQAMVELSGETSDMDRDFVLSILPEEAHQPRLYSEKSDDGSTAVMLHLIPSFNLDEQDTELIFVLDRSGSMEGKSMDLAKKALSIFLHSLPEDCYFNIVGFGRGYEFLFPASVKYSEKSLRRATEYVKVLRADLGATEMVEVLKKIYEMPEIGGHLRQLFILTDGEVSNTDVVLGIAQANANRARVFALGIGDGASHHLVEGIAKSGGGTPAFVTYNESMDRKLLNQLKNALRPSLTDIELEWEGVSVVPPQEKARLVVNKERTLMGYNKTMTTAAPTPHTEEGSLTSRNKQSPRRIPPVYDGSQMLVFGLFKDGCPKSVTVKARSPDGPLTISVKYSPQNDLSQKGLLHRLAAIKLVRELELELAAMELKGRSGARKGEDLIKEIVEIAMKNGITSKYTSFVAVDENDDMHCAENWVMETRNVPSQIPHGYAWQGGVTRSEVQQRVAAPTPARRRMLSQPRPDTSAGGIRAPGRVKRGGAPPPNIPKRFTPGWGARKALATKAPRRSAPVLVLTPSSDEESDVDEDEDSEVDAGSDVDDAAIYGAAMPECKLVKLTPTGADETAPLHLLVSLQSFDGSFSLSQELVELVSSKSLGEIKKALGKINFTEKIFATALAINFFERKVDAQNDEWELIVKKARKWLLKAMGMEQVDSVINDAEKYLKA